MKCPRCGAPMNEVKRSFHKQRKWTCPKCGRVRFQQIKKLPKPKRPEDE